MSTTTTAAAKVRWLALVAECGSDPVTEEDSILSMGDEFLPPCACAVALGGEPTAEYWQFLYEQTAQAQAEHDADYALGHKWHEEGAS